MYKITYRLFFKLPFFFLGYFKDLISVRSKKKFIESVNLVNTGFHVFEKNISSNDVDLLINEYTRLAKKNKIPLSGQQNGRLHSNSLLTPVMVKYVDKILPIVCDFLNTENVMVELSYFQSSKVETNGDDTPGGSYHIDDNKANVKYFVYLCDVNRSNGPFVAIPNSGSWKSRYSLIRGLLYELSPKRKYHYDFLRHITKKNKPKFFMGLKGFNFLVDTTSYHKAERLKKGSRLVMVISFRRSNL